MPWTAHSDAANFGSDATTPAGRPPAGEQSEPRRWLLLALVAAILGSLLGGGVVAVLDDDVDGARSPSSAPSRPSAQLADPGDIRAILDRVQPGVVAISTTGFSSGGYFNIVPRDGAGTGMVVSPEGEVLTNAHVVAGTTRIQVKPGNSDATYDAVVVGADPASDVALLRIQGGGDFEPVTLGRSADLQVGDQVVAIGHALALPGGPTVTTGIVSALDRSIGAGNERLEHLIQTDAAINPGNSGGPLVNVRGEVVGMNTAVIQQAGGGAGAQNIGFAIASDTLHPLLEELRTGRQGQSRAFLGVSTYPVDDDVRRRFALTIDEGALVVEVSPGSPADGAGLRPGDVITSLGGERVGSPDDLSRAVRAKQPGERVDVQWRRGPEERASTVVLSQMAG